MKQAKFLVLLMSVFGLSATIVLAVDRDKVAPAPNGIVFPADYRDWRVISITHRTDNQTMRVILGNDVAINAARHGETLPWPDGTVLGKVVWKIGPNKDWQSAISPNEFVHVEFMFKDYKKWGSSGGWGYARWKGGDLIPYGKDADFSSECITCHTPVKYNDWVFTKPAPIP